MEVLALQNAISVLNDGPVHETTTVLVKSTQLQTLTFILFYQIHKTAWYWKLFLSLFKEIATAGNENNLSSQVLPFSTCCLCRVKRNITHSNYYYWSLLYSAILRSFEQTHCTRMWFYMSEQLFYSAFFEYPPKWCIYSYALVVHALKSK